MEPSSTDDSRLPGALPQADVRGLSQTHSVSGFETGRLVDSGLLSAYRGQRWSFRPGRSREAAAHPGGGNRLRFTLIAMRARCASLVAFRMMGQKRKVPARIGPLI